MNKIISFIKDHPYGTAAGVFGVGVVYLLLRSSSSSSGTSTTTVSNGDSTADVQGATQVSLAQIAASAQNNQTSAAATVAEQSTAAQVSIAGIQGSTSTTNTTTNDNAQVSIAGLQAQTQQLISTLTAQTQDKQTDALTQIALAPYDVQLAQIQAGGNNSGAIAALTANLNSLTSAYNTFSTSITSPGAVTGHGLVASEIPTVVPVPGS